MKEDYFFDETYDQHLLEGEQVVWTGRARGLIPWDQWIFSARFLVAGLLAALGSQFFLPPRDASQGVVGLVLVAVACLALVLAAMPIVRTLTLLQKTRYVITTKRALILDGMVLTSGGQLTNDPVKVRAIPGNLLPGRRGPTSFGSIMMGRDRVSLYGLTVPVEYGFYACSEPEGADMEIRRLLGEVPVATEWPEAVA